jgi:hypothetical protein
MKKNQMISEEQIDESEKLIKKIHEKHALLKDFDYQEFCNNLDVIAFPIIPKGSVGSDYDFEEKYPPTKPLIKILYKAPKERIKIIKKEFLEKSKILRNKILINYKKDRAQHWKDYKGKWKDSSLKIKSEDIELQKIKFCTIWGRLGTRSCRDLSPQHQLHNQLFNELLKYEYDGRYGELAFRHTNYNRIYYATSPIYYKDFRNLPTINTGGYGVHPEQFLKTFPSKDGKGICKERTIWDLEDFYNNYIPNFSFYGEGNVDAAGGYLEYDNVFHIINYLQKGVEKFENENPPVGGLYSNLTY